MNPLKCARGRTPWSRVEETMKKRTINAIAIRSQNGCARRDDTIGPTPGIRVDPHQLGEGLVGHVDLLLRLRHSFLFAQALLDVVVEEIFEIRSDLDQDQAPGCLGQCQALTSAV